MSVLTSALKAARNLLFHGKYLSILISVLLLPIQSVQASWLDSDYWCRVYGCVVSSDGSAFDIYDVYDFSTGRTVPRGAPLIFYTGNPYQGTGVVNAVKTGTLTPAATPGVNQGMLVDIDQDGDLIADVPTLDGNMSGFLDLGDSLSSFSLSPNSAVILKDRAYTHSFYVASRTDFYIYGRAFLQSQSGDLISAISPDQTGFEIRMVRTGTDNGFSFGTVTANPRFRATRRITSLNDFWGVPTALAEIRRGTGTRGGNSPNVEDQAVRIDMEFQPPPPDFSYGTGELNYQVEYLFYNR